MLRRLLNIASIVCLVLCVALMGMWVRSYQTQDEFRGLLWGNRGIIIDSFRGRLGFYEYAVTKDVVNRFWPWTIGGRTILVHDDYDIDDGQLQGAFAIPSAGRYGSTVKIPLQTIRAAERRWNIDPAERNTKPLFRNACGDVSLHVGESAVRIALPNGT